MRALFIFAGLSLLEYFHSSIYLLGAFLVYGGIKSVLSKEEEDFKLKESRWYKLLCRFMPLVQEYQEDKFWIRHGGKLLFTPLFVALVSIEITDLIFAADSIPAILSISANPLIVYSSNIFAILGLRALYFVLEGTLHYFHLLNYGLAAILVFVGFKMMLIDIIHIEIYLSLLFIFLVLFTAVVLSLLFPKGKKKISSNI
jgi:tellurite resistance protein TerC